MKKENKVVINNKVILNSIQDLQRLPVSLVNNLRGRCQIKFGMTALFNNNAFTLIELLVVVLIIGILAAIAVPQYKMAVAKSRFSEMILLANAIDRAKTVYYLANGTYPHDFSLLDIDLPGCKLNNARSTCNFPQKKFTCAIYDDWTHCYTYGETNYYSISPASSAHSTIRQCAALKDNTLANQLCQSIGGNSIGINGNTHWYKID